MAQMTLMTSISRSITALFLILCASFFSFGTAAKEPSSNAVLTSPKLALITLNAGKETIKAEIAANEATRQQGLMFREKMAKNDGMLFVFPQLGYHAMWMKNTMIALSVAYMDDTGKIVSIHEMAPQTENSHQAAGPARFALEMNAMWFSAHKINVGDTITGLAKAPKPE